MAARYLSSEELAGARVYDSVGLFYGVAGGLRVQGGEVLLEVLVKTEARQWVVDVGRLRSMLLQRGLEVGGEETLETLVRMAREAGVDVPYTEAREQVSLLKGLVPSGEVEVADRREDVGGPGGLAVVLLKTPREADYRGEPAERRLAVREERELRGRPVISRSRGLLGVFESYVVGRGGLGIRAGPGRGGEGRVNWLGFLGHVRRVDAQAYSVLADLIDPYRSPVVALSELEGVRKVIRERGLEEALKAYVTPSGSGERSVDIPWSSVVSIADAIIVE